MRDAWSGDTLPDSDRCPPAAEGHVLRDARVVIEKEKEGK